MNKELTSGYSSLYPHGNKIDYTPFERQKKWGFFDSQGMVKIEPIFNDADYFSGGLAAVEISGLWGYIDENGLQVIQPSFSFAGPFHNGKALVTRNDMYELINMKGETIKLIKDEYEIDEPIMLALTQDDLIRIIKENRIGYINLNGEVVIQPQFVESGPFVNGLAWVKNESEEYYYINKDGERIFNIPEGYLLDTFSEGLAAVTNPDTLKSGFINTKGQLMIKEEYSNSRYFSEGLAQVMVNGKMSYINKTGQIAFPKYFDGALPFINGVALVSNGEFWGLINREGTYIYDNKKYDYVDVQSYLMNTNHFLVQMKDKRYYINRNTGEVLFEL